MQPWLRRLRGALLMGLVWGAGAGALLGGTMEFLANIFPRLNAVDMWIPLFAFPGFIGGVLFSVVLAVAARNRRLSELSMAAFTAMGAIGGLLLGGFAMAVGWVGGSLTSIALGVAAPTLMSAIAASGTLALARMAEREPGARVAGGDAMHLDAESRSD